MELQDYFDKMENSISPSSEIQNNDKIKVLGIVWDTVNDYLIYSFEDLVESLKSVIPSKRNNLSLIAKFYDPVGLIQPVITKLKLLFQDVCLKIVDWNFKITGQLKENWQFIVKFVDKLAAICINRCYFYDVKPRDYIVFYQLHGFSDASEKAYGCLYLFEMHYKKQLPFDFISRFEI